MWLRSTVCLCTMYLRVSVSAYVSLVCLVSLRALLCLSCALLLSVRCVCICLRWLLRAGCTFSSSLPVFVCLCVASAFSFVRCVLVLCSLSLSVSLSGSLLSLSRVSFVFVLVLLLVWYLFLWCCPPLPTSLLCLVCVLSPACVIMLCVVHLSHSCARLCCYLRFRCVALCVDCLCGAAGTLSCRVIRVIGPVSVLVDVDQLRRCSRVLCAARACRCVRVYACMGFLRLCGPCQTWSLCVGPVFTHCCLHPLTYGCAQLSPCYMVTACALLHTYCSELIHSNFTVHYVM